MAGFWENCVKQKDSSPPFSQKFTGFLSIYLIWYKRRPVEINWVLKQGFGNYSPLFMSKNLFAPFFWKKTFRLKTSSWAALWNASDMFYCIKICLGGRVLKTICVKKVFALFPKTTHSPFFHFLLKQSSHRMIKTT
jgi:hypothetical protein